VIELPDLHRAAREIFAEGLKGVDAGKAVRRAVRLDGSRLLNIVDTTFDLTTRRDRIYAIAIGKAASKMASALDYMIGDRLTAGIVACSQRPMSDEERLLRQLVDAGQLSEEEAKTPEFRDVILRAASQPRGDAAAASPLDDSLSGRWQVFAGGHPLPNEESLRAARASFELLRRADIEGALVIFLISGGGSAMIEWPRDEQTTLEELRAANRALVSCGASIKEINAVRRAFSAVKGGGLSARAPHADQVSLIISDTGAGEEGAVASGPTFEWPPDVPDAGSVIARYDLASRLPASILRAVNQPHVARQAGALRHSLRKHYVLLDNRDAIAAAAEAARLRGFNVEVAQDLIDQPVAEGSAGLLSRLHDLRRRSAASEQGIVACLISGGEFACPVKGDGTGGRNAETVLRCAIEMDAHARSESGRSSSPRMLALSAGTDGIDGNSPAAGALACETTLARARRLGLDAPDFLDRSDAYTFFDRLGDAIVTGATETNVRDLRIMLTG
jgi:glycerate 2-kinase